MNIISKQLKDTYRMMIDEVLSEHGLTNQCTFYYKNSSIEYCDNCIFDTITKVSSNMYNGTGPIPFVNNTICPQCMGLGQKQNNEKTKNITLAVLFDSKYFLNFDSQVVNVPNIFIQTICSIKYANDIRNASSMSIANLPNIYYERIGDINPVGLGDLDYIFTNWKKQ